MADFRFDAKAHKYYFGPRLLEGTTEVLKDNGFINTDYFTEEARVRGSYVHMLTQFMDEGDFTWEEARRLGLEGYCRSWDKLREMLNPKFLVIEKPSYHPTYLYGGMVDRIVQLQGQPFLWDLKTSKTLPKWTRYQTGAYAPLYPTPDGKPLRRHAVRLFENGDMAALSDEYTDNFDTAHFLAFLDTTRERRKNGITADA